MEDHTLILIILGVLSTIYFILIYILCIVSKFNKILIDPRKRRSSKDICEVLPPENKLKTKDTLSVIDCKIINSINFDDIV